MDIIKTVSRDHYLELIEQYAIEEHKTFASLKSLAGILAKSPVFITDWKVKDYNDCMKAQGSKSESNIYKYNCNMEHFYKWCCRAYDIKPSLMYLSCGNGWYVDEQGLMAITISREDYEIIRRLLVEYDFKGCEVNTRNKLIFELAWETLTAEEIRDLKDTDVSFWNGYCRLKLKSREVRIEDAEIIRDLEITIQQSRYYRSHATRPRGSYVDYVEAPYVIRAACTNANDSYDARIVNPFQVIKKRLRNVTKSILPHVNMDELCIEAIRRSRIIYEFQQNPAFTPQEMAQSLGKESFADLCWLRSTAAYRRKMFKAS